MGHRGQVEKLEVGSSGARIYVVRLRGREHHSDIAKYGDSSILSTSLWWHGSSACCPETGGYRDAEGGIRSIYDCRRSFGKQCACLPNPQALTTQLALSVAGISARQPPISPGCLLSLVVMTNRSQSGCSRKANRVPPMLYRRGWRWDQIGNSRLIGRS
jgi:hypothetical protein